MMTTDATIRLATAITPDPATWPQLLQRPVMDTRSLEAGVMDILMAVQKEGDAALLRLTRAFDGVQLSTVAVSAEERKAACAMVSEDLREAIAVAQSNITRFHELQKNSVTVVETMPGVRCWRKSVPIEKVGLYIPGGTAPLFSTLLMLGIPATLAGCAAIVVCTPCDKAGQVHPVILYVADLLGITQIFKVGGAQAIGAMTFGTATIPKVAKIFGPGNQYVTCAKQLVATMGVAIDMPAGPSEVAVYADDTCDPAFVAADLLSQAEHGTDSQVLLVVSTPDLVPAVEAAITGQLRLLPRKDFAAAALHHSRCVVMPDRDAAFALLNAYAPEHLIIASDDALALSEKVINAGSVFIGHYAPESAGDYASGTNHTLPTNGYAQAYSGVSLDSFVKKITYQQLSPEGLALLGPAVETMAIAEGLYAHQQAVHIRLQKMKQHDI
jgi:histidinol dehydrogenase